LIYIIDFVSRVSVSVDVCESVVFVLILIAISLNFMFQVPWDLPTTHADHMGEHWPKDSLSRWAY